MKSAEIEQLLPGIFQRTVRPGGPLAAFLDVMEQLHAPIESQLADLDRLLDPRLTPDRFVPLLARWLDLDRLFEPAHRGREPLLRQVMPSGLGRLRELAANAAMLSQWRGTGKGLLLFLRIATGLEGFDVDERVPGPDGRPLPFHVRVTAPPEAQPLEGLIRRIIDSEKPAYVTDDLQFRAPATGPPADPAAGQPSK